MIMYKRLFTKLNCKLDFSINGSTSKYYTDYVSSTYRGSEFSLYDSEARPRCSGMAVLASPRIPTEITMKEYESWDYIKMLFRTTNSPTGEFVEKCYQSC